MERIRHVLDEGLLKPVTEQNNAGLHNSRSHITLWFRNGENSRLVLKLKKCLEHASLSILWLVWLIWSWDRAGKISVRLLVKVHLHCQMPVTWACYSCVPGSCGLGSCVKPQQHWRHDTCGMACGSDVSPMSVPAINPLKNVRISINRSDNHLHQWQSLKILQVSDSTCAWMWTCVYISLCIRAWERAFVCMPACVPVRMYVLWPLCCFAWSLPTSVSQ